MDRSFLGQNKRRVSFFHVKHAYLTLRIGLPTRYEREPSFLVCRGYLNQSEYWATNYPRLQNCVLKGMYD